MSARDDDIRVRIAGDLADIRKALQDLKRQAEQAGRGAKQSGRDWNELGGRLDSVTKKAKQLVAAYAGFRTVQTLVRSVISASVEAERVQAQLEARVRSTGGAAGFSAEQLLDMASSLQRVTTYGDEAIAAMQGVLLQFTNVRGDIFLEATEGTLDFATALGRDLQTAALQVGKALNDPIQGLTALREVGVRFTAAQRDQIRALVEANDIVGAQRIILDGLQQSMGGAARAARNTLGGALESVKNAFGDLFEASGAAVEGTTEAVNELVAVLQDPATLEAMSLLANGVTRVFGLATKMVTGLTVAITGATPFAFDNEIKRAMGEVDRLERLARSAGVLDIAPEEAERAGPAEQLVRELAAARAELDDLRRRQQESFVQEPPEPAATLTPPETVVDNRPQLENLRDQLARSRTLLEDELKRLRDALDRDLQANLLSFRDYYTQRAALETQAIDARIAEHRASISLLDEEIRLAKERDEKADDAARKRAALLTDITVLERERADVAGRAARDQAEAERGLADQLERVRQRLLELQGNTAGARAAALASEYRELLERLQLEGDAAGEALVRQLIDVEVARARFSELETEYQRSLDNMARAEQRIETAAQTGVITESEARRQLIELHRETAAEVERLIPLMRELAEATGDPAAIERIKDLELELEQLGQIAGDVGKELRDNLRDAGESAFSSFLDGTKSAKEALQDFIADFRRRIADLVAEKLFDQLFDSLSGLGGGAAGAAGGGGGGFKDFFAGLFHRGGVVGEPGPTIRIPALAFAGAPRYHGGGPVLAPDERAAILRVGEEVLTPDDPRHRDNGGLGGPINVYVQTQDVRSFRRESPSQIAASVASTLFHARSRNSA